MSEAAESFRPPRPRAVYWVFSLAIAAFLLWYSLRGIDWGRVWIILRGARPEIVGLVVLIMTCSLFLRSVRWRVLLSAEGRVPVLAAFWAAGVPLRTAVTAALWASAIAIALFEVLATLRSNVTGAQRIIQICLGVLLGAGVLLVRVILH